MMIATVNRLSQWESAVLSSTGNYIGLDLTFYGFPWSPGNWIPANQRHSAFLEWRAAFKKLVLIGRHRNRPDLVSENQVRRFRKSIKDPLFDLSFELFAGQGTQIHFTLESLEGLDFRAFKRDFDLDYHTLCCIQEVINQVEVNPSTLELWMKSNDYSKVTLLLDDCGAFVALIPPGSGQTVDRP